MNRRKRRNSRVSPKGGPRSIMSRERRKGVILTVEDIKGTVGKKDQTKGKEPG